jgi:CRP-like cAMP-binding protein
VVSLNFLFDSPAQFFGNGQVNASAVREACRQDGNAMGRSVVERSIRVAQVAVTAGSQTRPASEPPIADPFEALGCPPTTLRCRRGEEIYAPDDRADYWYRVIAGMARKCAVKADGRRQIVDFLLPDDFFGLITRHEHRFAVEAVLDGTEVARYPRGKIERLADFDARIGRRIREAAFEAISRSQSRMLILGRMSALEKVGAFLVEMAERSRPGAPEAVVLTMSRYDIADYLGLAAETVSRTLSDLRQSGAIRLEGAHRVRILDRASLEQGDGDAAIGRANGCWR